MTKAEIATALSQNLNLSRKESAELVDTMLEMVRERLEEGEMVKLSGFGRFRVASKTPRPGRNPKTGEDVEISARKVVVFKASPMMLTDQTTPEARKQLELNLDW